MDPENITHKAGDTHTLAHSLTHTYEQFCIHSLPTSMFCEMKGNRRTYKKHVQTLGEHAKLHTDSNLTSLRLELGTLELRGSDIRDALLFLF